MDRNSLLLVAFCSLLAASATGCQQKPADASGPDTPVIPISKPVERDVRDSVEYTGRIAAVNAVDIRARVTGYLVQAGFKEGSEVKAGQLLYQVDPRPYQAVVDAAKAQLTLSEANYRLATAELTRSKGIAGRDPTAISREELEQYQAQEAQTKGTVGVAEANLASAQLNLDWTRVTSPIDGQVSRFYYTVGNLAIQDQTLLTTVVSLDKMYAYFDMDERTLQRIRKAINAGKIQVPQDRTPLPLFMALEEDEGYPHEGTLDFVNNQVNPSTGTIAVRGIFDNPKPPNGRRLLSPGMFVRIQLPIGQKHPALLVADQAVGSDQGLKFVYVIGKDKKVEYRRVTTGALQDDGLRVIDSGVNKDDWVIVGGLQQVRPNMEVETEETAMPALGTPAGGQAPGLPKGPQPPPHGGEKK